MLKSIFRNYTYIITFLLPAFLLAIIFVLWHVYPFGGHSILMGDQYTQYIQFYNHFYDVIKGNGSLLYSWEAGMGLNFWGTFTYYLSSPISFVVLLFDRDHLPEAFILMTLLKIGLSGLMMCIYLSKTFKSGKIAIVTFSTIHALMSFSIAFFYNIMWLDTIYLLPLVLLGIEKLFEKKYFLLIVSLTLLFITNFYMAYIAGIFAFLYFIIRSVSKTEVFLRILIKDFLRFIGSTLMAAGISAFLIIPTYLQIKSNAYSGPSKWIGFFNVELGFFDFIAKLYNSSENLFTTPNVFSSLLVLLLAPLFFMSPKIKKVERILFFFLTLFLILSFQIKGLNIIWHAFEPPSGYLQRFAFVFSFLMIYFAFRAYLVFDRGLILSLFKVYCVNVFILILLTELSPDLMSLKKAIVNILLLTVFTFLIYGKEMTIKYYRFIVITLILFVCADLGLNIHSHLKTLNGASNYNIERSEYNIATPGFDELVNEINAKDTSFYRVNSMISLTLNDSLRYGYKGMDNFNTLSNGALHEFMNDIGYSATLGARSLSQSYGILTSDALLGFKYVLTDQPINKYGYTIKTCKKEVCLYENKNVIPAGFMINPDQVDFETNVDNPFINQNILLGSTSEASDYFTQMNTNEVKYNNLEIKDEGNIRYVKKIDPNLEGSIEWTFDLKGKKQFYTLLSAGKGYPGYDETEISVNGKSLGLYPTFHNDRILDLGAYNNEKVTVKVAFSVPDTQLTQQFFYALDIDRFEGRINELKQKSFEVTKWTETSMEGKITANKPNALFLSIPYDEGWRAEVDGENVPITKLGGFIGVHLDEGSHQVTLSFMPKGFMVGCIISISSLIGLFIIMFVKRKKRAN